MKTKFTLTLTLFMALIVQLTFAQQRTISGTVSDENGLSLSGLADGSYFLVVDLYDNPFSTLNTGQPLPITLNISQEYFPETETTIIHNGYTTDSSSGLQAIATLDVVGGYNYTFTPL